MAAERMPTALDVVESAVRTREIKLYGKPRNVGPLVDAATFGFQSTVLDEADRIFGERAAVLDGIVVGGGGAELLFGKLRERFPNAICGDEPRMMVAEGFCRLGLMSLTYP
jgi:plasmid segregation protein ParM